jgi:serine/threonine protein kinase/Tol biopolymer transport system component
LAGPDMIGTTLLHYRIVSRLGAGGMGEVFAAEDLKLHRTVALKVLPEAVASDPERRQRFEREARIAGALNHPNIVTLYSVETSEERLFITMELVRGTVLGDRIPSDGMRVPDFLDLAIPMADALAAAHASGVVHRDLKPHNVMVSDEGRVKVLDFGLALADSLFDEGGGHHTTARLTQHGHVVGTYAFMAPEQAEGKRVDARSDIFSLGAVFYQMLTGLPPFKGESAVSTLAAVIRDDPRPLSDLKRGIPRNLARIVARCLAKDASRRYQSAADLRSDLEDIKLDISSGIVESAPAGTAVVTAKVRRWLWPVALIAVAAVMALAGYFVPRPEPQRPPTSDGTFDRLTSRAGEELSPAVSPDGEFVAYASQAAGNWDIYLQRIGGDRPINLTDDSASADTEPAFSPDGRSIAFRSERNGGGLFVMGATGEDVKRVSVDGYNPAWSPDGTELLFNLERITDPTTRTVTGNQLWAVELASGQRRLVVSGDAVQASWSPSGGRVAFWGVHRGGQRDIWTVAASGGALTSVTDDDALDWNPVWAPDGRHLYFVSERGGTMNLWRVAIDERSGDVRSSPEPVTAPSAYVQHLSFAKSGRRLAYVDVTRRVPLQRLTFDPNRLVVSEPSWILQDARPAKNPDLSTDGLMVAFDSVEGTQEDLYVVRVDGSGLRRLTDDPFIDRAARWAPDGRQLLFLSDRSGRYENWRVNPDGSGLEQVSFTEGARWAQLSVWSPDGSRIAVNRQASAPLIIDARLPWAKQSPLVAAPNDDPNRRYNAWSWSRDGRVLAGHSGGIVTYNLATRTFQQLTDYGERPVWLSDHRRLAFMDSQKIYVLDTATRRVAEVYSAAPHRLQSFLLSADDRTIVVALAITEADIWLASLR